MKSYSVRLIGIVGVFIRLLLSWRIEYQKFQYLDTSTLPSAAVVTEMSAELSQAKIVMVLLLVAKALVAKAVPSMEVQSVVGFTVIVQVCFQHLAGVL